MLALVVIAPVVRLRAPLKGFVFLGSRAGRSQGFKDDRQRARAPAKNYDPARGALAEPRVR